MKKALILVDIQNDFCKDGSLEVPQANEIIEKVNKHMNENKYDLIVATLDWHPENHSSFITNNPKTGIWPVHCVEDSLGALLNKDINSSKIDAFVTKGTNPEIDSYSGFFDNDQKSKTELDDLLKNNSITSVDIVGLALDYCVKATALDAQKLNYKTTVILEATKAVNLNPEDGEKAILELKQAGVIIK